MADLTLSEIFGASASLEDPGIEGAAWTLRVPLLAFQDSNNGGDILNGLGFDNVGIITSSNADQNAVNLFYALLLLISQNQAENINADPEQKIFISNGGKRFATGIRQGQIQQVFNVNLFFPSSVPNLPDLDYI